MADWPTIPAGAGYPLVNASTGEFLSTAVNGAFSATFVPGAVVPLYADAFGCKGDGITDDTAALTALYTAAAARAKSASVFGAVTQIVFRAGRYIDSLARVFDFRVILTGEGKDQTILYRKNGSTGDFLTFNASYSGTEKLTVDGNKNNCPSGGDNVVLNAYRTTVLSCVLTKARVNNLTIGKTSAALGHILFGLGVSLAGEYGIRTVAGSGSTDGLWTLLDVGQNGKSGVRLDQGAQNILGLHSWGNGIEDATDKHGIHVNSSSNVIVAAQSETNLGAGVYISGSASRDNEIDVKSWGNMGAGIWIYQAPAGKLTGRAYRNGVANEASGSSSTAFAGVLNDSGTDWHISVSCRDDTAVVQPGDYTTAPAFPFPGRSAGGAFTQTYGYAEVGTADRNVLVGCKMRKEDHKSGAILIVGNNDRISAAANDFGGVAVPTRSVVSGAVRAPADSDYIEVATSGANITSVLGHYPGRRVTIRFVAATPGTVTHSTALRLAGNVDWTPSQYATLTLISDGANWYETGRKA